MARKRGSQDAIVHQRSRSAACSHALEVGEIKNGTGERFIAVPHYRAEGIKKPLSGLMMTAIRIGNDDLEWLIGALADEIGPDRWEAAAEEITTRICCER
jgi:hypothetical protein